MDGLIRPVDYAEASTGNWKIEKFTVDDHASFMHDLPSMSDGIGGRSCPPGDYTKLVHRNERGNDVLVMSDTPAELSDLIEPVSRAAGDVLINGLGLGCVPAAFLRKDTVTSVTVIEISSDVIRLVAPYLADDRITVIHADAFTWQPPKGQRYRVVWHDIWSTISTGNIDGMKRLHRRYGRRADWQGSWARGLCEHYAREERNYYGFSIALVG